MPAVRSQVQNPAPRPKAVVEACAAAARLSRLEIRGTHFPSSSLPLLGAFSALKWLEVTCMAAPEQAALDGVFQSLQALQVRVPGAMLRPEHRQTPLLAALCIHLRTWAAPACTGSRGHALKVPRQGYISCNGCWNSVFWVTLQVVSLGFRAQGAHQVAPRLSFPQAITTLPQLQTLSLRATRALLQFGSAVTVQTSVHVRRCTAGSSCALKHVCSSVWDLPRGDGM